MKKLFMIFTVLILMSSLVSAQNMAEIDYLGNEIQDVLDGVPLLSGVVKNADVCVIVHKNDHAYSFEVDYEVDEDDQEVNLDVDYHSNFMCDGANQEDFIININNYNYFEDLADELEQFSVRRIRSLVSLIMVGAKMDYYQILPSKFLELGGKLVWNAETQSKYSNLFKFAGRYTKGKVSLKPRPYSERYHRNYVEEPKIIDQGGKVVEEEEEELVEVIEEEEVEEEEVIEEVKEEAVEEETEEENLVIKDIHITDFKKTIEEKRPYSMRIDRRSVRK